MWSRRLRTTSLSTTRPYIVTDVSALAATKAVTTTVMGAANDVPLPRPRPMLKTNLFI